ncbi:hypothetical protein I316_06182 [Kwoniella heveanensis BCC8398]|uniref:Uncharacterized protein n=1 Tax=Kwoniella heveanensis BCC8398 TaxID=1296120 RepID=A0A1B9GMQ1_9TREE|nr:hypothetical protein I316_06182 [Kwoniella heveanensis BCC8398]
MWLNRIFDIVTYGSRPSGCPTPELPEDLAKDFFHEATEGEPSNEGEDRQFSRQVRTDILSTYERGPQALRCAIGRFILWNSQLMENRGMGETLCECSKGGGRSNRHWTVSYTLEGQ